MINCDYLYARMLSDTIYNWKMAGKAEYVYALEQIYVEDKD